MTITNYTTFQYNGITYDIIQDTRKSRVPHTNKQTNGVRVSMSEAIGSNTFDRVFDLTIKFTPNSAGSITDLETADDGQKHAYSDGVHSGNFFIATGSISEEADATSKQSRVVSFRLIEW